MKILAEGWAQMNNVTGRQGGALPERPPPGVGPPSIPERVGPGRMTQLGSLPCAGMSLGGAIAGACALPLKQAPLPPSTAKDRKRWGPLVHQTLWGEN